MHKTEASGKQDERAGLRVQLAQVQAQLAHLPADGNASETKARLRRQKAALFEELNRGCGANCVERMAAQNVTRTSAAGRRRQRDKGSAPRREGADLRDAEESLNLGISIRCYD